VTVRVSFQAGGHPNKRRRPTNKILLFALTVAPVTLIPALAYAWPRNPFAYYQTLFLVPY
jgi:hypothetical protein